MSMREGKYCHEYYKMVRNLEQQMDPYFDFLKPERSSSPIIKLRYSLRKALPKDVLVTVKDSGDPTAPHLFYFKNNNPYNSMDIVFFALYMTKYKILITNNNNTSALKDIDKFWEYACLDIRIGNYTEDNIPPSERLNYFKQRIEFYNKVVDSQKTNIDLRELLSMFKLIQYNNYHTLVFRNFDDNTFVDALNIEDRLFINDQCSQVYDAIFYNNAFSSAVEEFVSSM